MLIATPPSTAQVAPASATAVTRVATRALGTIVMDGKLDEPDWARATPITRFYEDTPSDRGPPPERTEVRYLYNDRFLYVGVRAFTDGTGRPREPFARRDRVDDSMDYIQFYIDPLGTGRSSYLFRINPRGVKTDGIRDETSASETLAPDFDWDVATSRDKDSWTAELVIPLSTLRIPRVGKQNWILVAYRGLNRQQDHQFLDYPLPRTASCLFCYAGKTTFPDLAPDTEHLLISPSFVPSLHQDGSRRTGALKPELHIGLNVKWLPYQGGVADLTVKPDFTDVDPDDLQLTANARFAIDLPEKRPFFLEGSDLIGTPIPILCTRNVAQPTVGARFTHRSDTLNATAFVSGDDGRGAIIEPGLIGSDLGYPTFDTKVGYARGQLALGAFTPGATIAVKRDDDGSYNRVESIDGSWTKGPDRITAQIAASQTRDPDRPDILASWMGQHLQGAAADIAWNHAADLSWTLEQSYYGRGFRAWLGYVPRVGFAESKGEVKRTFFLEHGLLSSVAPFLKADFVQGLGGRGTEHDYAPGIELYGVGTTSLSLAWHPDATVLVAEREPRSQDYLELEASSSPTRWLPSVNFDLNAGRLVDFDAQRPGSGITMSGNATLRPSDRIQFRVAYGATRIAAAPGGERSLHETVRQITATYYFSARLYALAEYQDDRSRRFFPARYRDRSHQAEAQLVWDFSRDLQMSAGIRREPGIDAAGEPVRTDTRFYVKLAPTLRLFRRKTADSSQ